MPAPPNSLGLAPRRLRRARVIFIASLAGGVIFTVTWAATYRRGAWGIYGIRQPPSPPVGKGFVANASYQIQRVASNVVEGPEPGARWPQYAAVHRGRVLLFSTLWRCAPGFAWNTPGWMYDAMSFPDRRWLPGYDRIGSAYGGTSSRPYKARMHAVSVPLWNLAAPCILLAAWSGRKTLALRRSLLIQACISCGYPLGDHKHGVCPECGTPFRNGDPWASPAAAGGSAPSPGVVRSAGDASS